MTETERCKLMNTDTDVLSETKNGKGHQDLRVLKTRKNLKSTLRQLLTVKPFEKITVKEICEEALTSRITFYNYYSDKYALLEDLFRDMNEELDEEFEKRQKDNTADDPVKSYENLLDCFLAQYFSLKDIARQVNLEQNTFLLYPYYHYMVDNTTRLVEHYFNRLKPNYPPEQLSSFIVMGIYGYLHFSGANTPEEQRQVTRNAHRLLSDLLHSDIFRKVTGS